MTKNNQKNADNLSDLSENGHDSFDNLVNELPLGVLSCDREGNITAVNDFLLNILGSPSTDFTKQFNILTFQPLIECGISGVIEETLTTGRNSSIETSYRTVFNKDLFLSFKVFPRKDDNGFVYGCHAIIEDLTTRNRTNIELEESKNKDILISHISSRFINSNFKDIDENINKTLKDLADFIGAERIFLFNATENTDYIIKTHEWHVDGVISKIPLNEKWDTKKLLFEQLSNLQIVNIPDIDKIPQEKEYLQKVLQNLGIKSIAMIPLSRNGTFKGFIGVDSKSTKLNWNEKQLYVLKIAGDMITRILERKDAEVMMLQKEKEYEEVVNSLDAIIWKATFDKDGNVLTSYISKPVDKVLDLPDGTIGNDWNRFFAHIHPEDLQKVLGTFKMSFLQPDIPINQDYRLLSDEGKSLWINSIGSSHLQSDGTFLTYGTSMNITPRKLAEEEVARSEERYRSLVEELSDAVIINTFKGEILEVNDKTCEMLGYSREELQNMTIYDLMPPERRASAKENMSRFIKNGKIQAESRFITADGNLLIVEVNAKALKGYNNTSQALVRDITERKEAEIALRESEERFKVLHNASFGGITIHDKGMILDCNQGLSEITGYSYEELVGMDGLLLIAESFRSTVMDNILQGYEEPYEVMGLRKDGSVYPLRLEAKSIPYKGKKVRVVEFRDITDQKKAEKALIDSEKKYRGLFENSMNEVVITEIIKDENDYPVDFVFKEVNDSFQEHTGLKAEDVIGKRVTEVYPGIEKRKNTFLDLYRNVALTGIPAAAEIYSDELKKHFSINAYRLGENIVVGVSHDITKRKNAENKLIEHEEKLRLFIEHAPVSLVMLDRDMRHIATSRQFINDFSLGNRDITGMHHYDVIPQLDDEHKAMHRRALQGEVVPINERHFEGNNGRVHWLRGEVRPWKAADGTIGGIIVFVEHITERKEAEEKLKESEALLSEVGRIGKIGGWELDVASGKGTWTSESAEIHEQDKDNPSTVETELTFYPPGSRDIIENAINIAIEKAEPYDLELEFITAKGNHRWVRTSGRPKIIDGKVAKVTGTLQDITERKIAEHELKLKEEKYRSLFEQSNDAIFLNHVDGQIMDVNEKACKIFGYTRQEFQKMNVSDLLAPRHKAAGERGMQQFREDGSVYLHTLYAKANGETFDAEVNAKVLEGYPDLAQAIVRDISKQKKAEEEIIRNETKYRSLFEKSNDAIMIHDLNGRILEANDRACEMFGYSETELKQKSIMDLTLDEDRVEIKSRIGKIKTEGYCRKENRMVRSDGGLIYVDVSASFLQTQHGMIQTVGRDITDRVRTEAAMISAKIEAETASRTKSEFLANMSHELRTPLNSIIGFSDVMFDGLTGELGPKQKNYMKHISDSGHHLLNLINDILDISKVEAGKMELHIDMLNMKTVIDDIVAMTQTLTSRKNISVNVDVQENMPTLRADRSKIKQIMYNLMGNAIKFTDDGGKITILTKVKGKKILVSIIDNGIGISTEDQKKLFKPFSQIDSSISRSYQGTGLGLALVKELIELHGGNIRVESEVGKGSNFTFELPIGDDDLD